MKLNALIEIDLVKLYTIIIEKTTIMRISLLHFKIFPMSLNILIYLLLIRRLFPTLNSK